MNELSNEEMVRLFESTSQYVGRLERRFVLGLNQPELRVEYKAACLMLDERRAELVRRLTPNECCTSKSLHPADAADLGLS